MPERQHYSFHELTERAVRNAISRTAGPSARWVAVRDTFAVGSRVAIGLCKAYGLDPYEFVHGAGGTE